MIDSKNAWRGFFEGWSGLKTASFALCLLLVLLLLGSLAWWTQRAPQAVLFSDLAERDAAVLSAELDKLKQPYSLSEDGRTILVSADNVHKTRMALMGKPLPLHGAVGFELFNNTDFGVSDFVQKVNYQRALQGELTRTILSIDQIQDARVHLALPDSALFRKDGPRAKASVTLTLKGRQPLQADQVLGIQRLVAASVAEVRPEDVTVLDQHGVALSRPHGEDAEATAMQLDARQGMEAHFTRKVSKLLDQWLAPGESMVAVDVVLDHEQAKITTEEVLGSPHPDRSSHPAGVLTRERSSSREAVGESGTGAGNGSGSQLLSQEMEYQTGRRVSQVNSPAGRIARLNVAVVVKRALSDADMERARQLVATAVGLQPDRGDHVSVQSLAAQWTPATSAATASVSTQNAQPAERPVLKAQPADAVPRASAAVAWALAALLGVLLLALAAGRWHARGARQGTKPEPGQRLATEEREALLKTLQQWLEPQR
ncbi:flagellar basal-body MS-ring/collar protein FliF [Roseateles sp. DB2]|uniref:flagellar basal-body MS-ring/collar protein FliF n=1 Tax=Roseateles sp. DB2 TaxID=3453717 RepID=UPI003EF02A34